MEIYSIDESFLSLRGLLDPLGLSKRMRETVRKWTGIPISVGLGKTKTLAKLPIAWPRKTRPVVSRSMKRIAPHRSRSDRGRLGVGRRLSLACARIGLGMPGLSAGPSSAIRTIGGVTLERTQRELSGIACLEMEEVPQPRKNTCCSRSFGKPLTEVEELGEAVANYAVRASARFARKAHLPVGYRFF